MEIINIIDDLAKHPTKKYRKRDIVNVDTIVIHHTAVRPSVSAQAVARYHVDHNDWPGIGYHFYITSDGVVFQTNEIETLSYHAYGHNWHTIGICLAGNFTDVEPPDAQIEACATLIAFLRARIDWFAVRPHRAMSQTACPGATFDSWFYRLEAPPQPPQPDGDCSECEGTLSAVGALVLELVNLTDRLVQLVSPDNTE